MKRLEVLRVLLRTRWHFSFACRGILSPMRWMFIQCNMYHFSQSCSHKQTWQYYSYHIIFERQRILLTWPMSQKLWKLWIAQILSRPLTTVGNHLAPVFLVLVRVPSTCCASLCELWLKDIYRPGVTTGPLVEQWSSQQLWAVTEGFQVRLPLWVMIHPKKTY